MHWFRKKIKHQKKEKKDRIQLIWKIRYGKQILLQYFGTSLPTNVKLTDLLTVCIIIMPIHGLIVFLL